MNKHECQLFSEPLSQIRSCYHPTLNQFLHHHMHLYTAAHDMSVMLSVMKHAFTNRSLSNNNYNQYTNIQLHTNGIHMIEFNCLEHSDSNSTIQQQILQVIVQSIQQLYNDHHHQMEYDRESVAVVGHQYQKPKHMRGIHQIALDIVQQYTALQVPILFVVSSFDAIDSHVDHSVLSNLFQTIHNTSCSLFSFCTLSHHPYNNRLHGQYHQTMSHMTVLQHNTCKQIHFPILSRHNIEQYLLCQYCSPTTTDTTTTTDATETDSTTTETTTDTSKDTTTTTRVIHHPLFIRMYMSTVYHHIKSLTLIVSGMFELHSLFMNAIEQAQIQLQETGKKNTKTTTTTTTTTAAVPRQVLINAWIMIEPSVKQLLFKHCNNSFNNNSQDSSSTNSNKIDSNTNTTAATNTTNTTNTTNKSVRNTNLVTTMMKSNHHHMMNNVLWNGLSLTHQYLLIAAYLASNSDAKKDYNMFSKHSSNTAGGGGKRRSNKRRKLTNKTTSSDYQRATSHKKREFDITRLLAIVNHLMMIPNEFNAIMIRYELQDDINSCIRDLIMRQYLVVKDGSSSSTGGIGSTSQAFSAATATQDHVSGSGGGGGGRSTTFLLLSHVHLDKMIFTLSDMIDYEQVQQFCLNCHVQLDEFGLANED